MKDYRLSEITAHCEEMCGDCNLCESEDIGICYACKRVSERFTPTVWWNDIEPRDMIELPSKVQVPYVKGVNVFMYQVLWRNRNGDGFVCQRFFNTEPEADAFLEHLKGDKA